MGIGWAVIFGVGGLFIEKSLVFIFILSLAKLQAGIDFIAILNITLWWCKQDVVTPTPSEQLAELLEDQEV